MQRSLDTKTDLVARMEAQSARPSEVVCTNFCCFVVTLQPMVRAVSSLRAKLATKDKELAALKIALAHLREDMIRNADLKAEAEISAGQQNRIAGEGTAKCCPAFIGSRQPNTRTGSGG